MDEKALEMAYKMAVEKGYKKSKAEFISLLSSNQEALKMSYELARQKGYAKSLDDYSSLLGVKKKDEEFISDGQSTLSNQAEAVKESRGAAMKNDDGSVSTVKMMSYEQDGKYYAAPTLFPKDPNKQTEDPADWIELQGEEAIKEAEKRGEVYQFNTDAEAKAFAEGGWKNTIQKEKPKTPVRERVIKGDFGALLDVMDATNMFPIKFGSIIQDLAYEAKAGFEAGQEAGDILSGMVSQEKANSDDVVRAISNLSEMQDIPPSESMKNFMSVVEGEDNRIYGLLKGFVQNPRIAPEVLVRSFAQMFNPASGIAAGTTVATGAGVGSVVPGAGTAAGAIASLPFAFAASGAVVEVTMSFAEFIREEADKQGKEVSEDVIRDIFSDPNKYSEMRQRALARGGTIALIDMVSAKIGGRVGAQLIRKGKAISAIGATTAIEAVGGSGGESIARVVAGQEQDAVEIFLEGIAGTTSTPVDIIAELAKKPSKYQVNGAKASRGDVDDIITNAKSIDDLGKINIDILNDEELNKKLHYKKVYLSTLQNVKQANPNLEENIANEITKLQIQLDLLENNKSELAKKKKNELRASIDLLVEGSKKVEEKESEVTPAEKAEEVVVEPIKQEQDEKQMRPEGEGEATEKVAIGKGVVPKDVESELTEDGEGNYIFHHYSQERRDVVKPGKGENRITSKSEANVLSGVGGLAMYYTKQGQEESGVGDILHTVKIPKEKVLLFNTLTADSEIFKEAERQFKAKFGDAGFGPNQQVSWVTKVANDMGYDMVLAKWGKGFRAQTTKTLTPEEQNVPFKQQPEANYAVGTELIFKDDTIEITGQDEDRYTYRSLTTNAKGSAPKSRVNLLAEPVYEFMRPTEDANQKADKRGPEWDNMTKKALPESTIESKEELENTLKNGKFGMLTGENPEAGKVGYKTNAENRELNAKARTWLEKLNYKIEDIFGKYGLSELSFFVKDLSVKHALMFMKEFNQESVALDNMILYNDGSYRPKINVNMGRLDENDMYSTMKIKGENVDFSIEYDFNQDALPATPEIQSAMDEIAKEEYASKPIPKDVSYKEDVGYDRMMAQIKGIILKSQRRGVPYKNIMDRAMAYMQKSAVYERASDVQREQMVRDLNKQFGRRLKSAPRAERLLGNIKNIKKITIDEMAALKNQLLSEAKGAKNAIAARKILSVDIINELKEFVKQGKISQRQLISVSKKLSTLNVFDDAKVGEFIEYMKNVFEISEYNQKVSRLNARAKMASKAVDSKIGVAKELAPVLKKIFALKASKIPSDVFGKYEQLVEMMSERKAVLNLSEINEMMETASEIMNAVLDRAALIDELKNRFNEYDSPVIDAKTGKLKYADTLDKMVYDQVITIEERQLMKDNKSIIIETESDKMTEADMEAQKEEYLTTLKETSLNSSQLATPYEREIARKLERLIRTKIVETLDNAELASLIRLVDNINNGFMPHYAQIMLEKLNSKSRARLLTRSILEGKITSLENAYTKIKTLFTKNKNQFLSAIERNPLYFIDQVFGNYNTKTIFNTLFKPLAEAYSKYRSEFNTVEGKVGEALNKLSKSVNFNPNKIVESKFRITAYMLQLEYESNPGNKEVNKAADFLKSTIEAFYEKPGSVNYSQRDIEALEKILKEFDENGDIDLNKMYESFSPAEKNLISTIQEINSSLTEKAAHTAAVIRGSRINPRANYVHIKSVGTFGNTEMDNNESLVQKFMRISRPSTKAQSLIERTGQVHPVDFDITSTALSGARQILIDFHMTEPVRESAKVIKETQKQLKDKGKDSKKILDALDQAREISLKNVLNSSFMNQSFADRVIAEINKGGYRAMLGSMTRSAAEYLSNFSFAMIKDRKSFIRGMKYGNVMTKMGYDIMMNVGSFATTRLYPTSTVSGRMVDMEMLNNIHGASSSTMNNDAMNAAQTVYNYAIKRGLKNPAAFIADTLISTPDKMVARPIWIGTFVSKFEEITSLKVDESVLKKIADGDEAFMDKYRDAIEVSKEFADNASVLASASDNPFTGILKNNIDPNDTTLLKTFKMFNGFMNRFLLYEYTTARTGIHAMMNSDIVSKEEGAKMVAAVTARMIGYQLLSKTLFTALASLILGGDDEDDEKTFVQSVGQATGSAMTSLILGRNFGNMTRGLISMPVEAVNKEYLDFLRNDEYNVYKDALTYSPLPVSKKPGDNMMWETMKNISGPYAPFIEAADRALEVTMKTPKTDEAIERRKQELTVRAPLEILGVSGFVPLYSDTRKILMKYLYKDIIDKKGMSESEFRNLYREDYDKLYKEFYQNEKLDEIRKEQEKLRKEQEKIYRDMMK